MPFTLTFRPVRWWCLSAAAGSAIGVGLFGPGAVAQPPAPQKSVPLTPPRPEPAEKGDKPEPAAAPTGETYPLAECIAIAMDRQPAIRAAKASLSASVAGQKALVNIHPFTTVLAPDLPVRREQATRGVTVATAEVMKAEAEAVHDIALMYYSYIYARQQEQTATDVLDQMQVYYGIARDILASGPSDKVNQYTLYTMEEAIAEVKKLRLDARNGQALALAALKEAMGVDPATPFTPRDTELPVMGGTVTQEQIVTLALARRAEVAQAAAGTDAFRLEVCAQDKIRLRQTVPTLAAGSDLHARQVPMALRNGEYRPGAIAPEMPPNLVGRRDDRVARAYQLSLRQDEVYTKTRDLVRLEAINAYQAWKVATEKMGVAKERFDRSQRMTELIHENARNAKIAYDVIVRAEAMAGRAQADYVSSVFDHIKALLRLQRVTAGGVVPAFPGK